MKLAGAVSKADCISCEAGKYNSSRGATECSMCQAGEYSTTDTKSGNGNGVALGATNCASCPAGKYTNNSMSYYCDSCSKGKSSSHGSTSCTSCGPGTYAESTGSDTCNKCEAGKYPNEHGKRCTQCPDHRYSKAGDVKCPYCEENYFLNKKGECEVCPDGARCDAYTAVQGIRIESDYYRFSNMSTSVYKCELKDVCLARPTNATGDDVCKDPNAKGPLCSYCKHHFYLDTTTKKCETCSRDASSLWFLLPTLAAILITFVLILRHFYVRGNNGRSSEAKDGRSGSQSTKQETTMITDQVGLQEDEITPGPDWMCGIIKSIPQRLIDVWTSSESTPLTLLWFTCQTTSQFVSKYSEVEYPTPFRELSDALDTITLHLTECFPKLCLQLNFYETLIISIFWWPIVVLLALLCIFCQQAINSTGRCVACKTSFEQCRLWVFQNTREGGDEECRKGSTAPLLPSTVEKTDVRLEVDALEAEKTSRPNEIEDKDELEDTEGSSTINLFQENAQKPQWARYLYNGVVLLLVLFHNMICTAIFNTFDCTIIEYDTLGSKYDGGSGSTKYLVPDMSINCNDNRYRSYKRGAYAAAVFYTGVIPIAFLFLLRHRESHPDLSAPLEFLVREVKPDLWWFEILALVFRFAFTGIILIIPDTSFRLIVGQVLAVVMLVACGAHRPYLNETSNNLALVAYTTLLYVAMFTSVLKNDTLGSDARETSFAIVLTCAYVVICGFTGYMVTNSPMKMLEVCLKDLEPLPADIFAKSWRSHKTELLRLLTDSAGSSFETVRQGYNNSNSPDEEMIKKYLDYVFDVLVPLKNLDGEIIWDEDDIPMRNYLTYINGNKRYIEIKCKMMKQRDLVAFQRSCIEIFGYLPKSDENAPSKPDDAPYHKVIKDLAKVEFQKCNSNTLNVENDRGVEESKMSSGDDTLEVSEQFIFEAVLNVGDMLISKIDTNDKRIPHSVKCYEVLKNSVELPCLELQASLQDDVKGIKEKMDCVEFESRKDKDRQPLFADISEEIKKLQDMMRGPEELNDLLHDQENPYKSFNRQLDDLVFPELLRAISIAIKDEFDEVINSVAADLPQKQVHVCFAPVKGVARMKVKRLAYEQDPALSEWPYSAYMFDVLRCSFVCADGHYMHEIWSRLQKDDRLTVVRLKNKASEETSPYNLHLNIAFQPECFKSRVIVEIQIHSKAIYRVKKLNHRLYQILRAPTAEKI